MNCTGLGPELDTVACNTDPCPGRLTAIVCAMTKESDISENDLLFFLSS